VPFRQCVTDKERITYTHIGHPRWGDINRRKIGKQLGYVPPDKGLPTDYSPMTGVCKTMVTRWIRAEMTGPVYKLDQIGALEELVSAHIAYRLDRNDLDIPFAVAQLEPMAVEVDIDDNTKFAEFLAMPIFNSFVPTDNEYYLLDMSKIGYSAGHTVGFKLTSRGGRFLDPNNALYEFASPARAKEALKCIFTAIWNWMPDQSYDLYVVTSSKEASTAGMTW
jgi:hypothetical protein